MPTYEYRCAKGHEFEKFQRMSDEPLKKCPECGSAAERLLSAGGGLLFKGSGFYETDYRSDSYRKAAEAEKKSGAGKSGDAAASKNGGGESGKTAGTGGSSDGATGGSTSSSKSSAAGSSTGSGGSSGKGSKDAGGTGAGPAKD